MNLKKLKPLFATALIATVLMSATACGATADDAQNATEPVIWTPKATTAAEETEPPTEAPTETTAETEAPAPTNETVFEARVISNEEIETLTNAIRFDDAEGDLATNIFFAGTNVTNFNFMEVTAEFDENGDFHVIDSTILFSLDELTTEEPLIIPMEFSELLPVRAVSYTDADGKDHFCLLTTSGEDGSLILTESQLPAEEA